MKLIEAQFYPIDFGFENLELDPWIPEGYRFRALSRFLVTDDAITVQPHKPFRQSYDDNKLLGGEIREYPAIDLDFITLPAFRVILLSFHAWAQTYGLGEAEITCHQLRIKAPAPLAPEGPHQDGVELIGLFLANRSSSLEGGFTQLSKIGEPGFQYNGKQEIGSMLIFKDQEYVHYGTPITGTGFFDALVFHTPILEK